MSPPWAVTSLLLLTRGCWPLQKLPKAQDLPGATLLTGALRCHRVLAGVWAFLQLTEGGFLELWVLQSWLPGGLELWGWADCLQERACPNLQGHQKSLPGNGPYI